MICPYLCGIGGPEAGWEGSAKSNMSPHDPLRFRSLPQIQPQMPFAKLFDVCRNVSSFTGHPSTVLAPGE